MVEDLK